MTRRRTSAPRRRKPGLRVEPVHLGPRHAEILALLVSRPEGPSGDLDADVLAPTRHLRDGRVEGALAPAGNGLRPRSRAPGVVRLRGGLTGALREAVELAMRDGCPDPLVTFDAIDGPPG